MAPRIARLGTPGARRAAVVVICHQGVQAGVGALDVVMVMTEGAYTLSFFPSFPLRFNFLQRRGEDKIPGNNLHVSGLEFTCRHA
jgi:hypothetical protein